MGRTAQHIDEIGIPSQEVFWNRLEHPAGASRRRFARVHANVPVRIRLTAAETVELRTNDLCILGLQVRCDRKQAERMRAASPAGTRAKPSFDVTLELEVQGVHRTVNARARITHLTLIQDAPLAEEVAVGFELGEFVGDGARTLVRFVEQHLRPAGA